MPLPDFINGFGFPERVRIGPKELAALSLFLEIMKDRNNQHIGAVKDDVSILTNKLLMQTIEWK